MTQHLSKLSLPALTLLGALFIAAPLQAQVAGGTTTVDSNVSLSTQVAMGWSVKKTLMGKAIYNDAGQKVGKVEDLIISPDKNLSYVIVGAGGFIGIGRHDVAFPVSQIQDHAGKLVISGVTKESIKAMPEFAYATDTAKRDAFISAADADITKGKAAVATLEKKAGAAAADAKGKLDVDLAALQSDIKVTETKLTAMKQAAAVRWKDFEADVEAATARLRKSTDKAIG